MMRSELNEVSVILSMDNSEIVLSAPSLVEAISIIWELSFSAYAQFSEKVTFFTPCRSGGKKC